MDFNKNVLLLCDTFFQETLYNGYIIVCIIRKVSAEPFYNYRTLNLSNIKSIRKYFWVLILWLMEFASERRVWISRLRRPGHRVCCIIPKTHIKKIILIFYIKSKSKTIARSG